jgi:hypothetical protein
VHTTCVSSAPPGKCHAAHAFDLICRCIGVKSSPSVANCLFVASEYYSSVSVMSAWSLQLVSAQCTDGGSFRQSVKYQPRYRCSVCSPVSGAIMIWPCQYCMNCRYMTSLYNWESRFRSILANPRVSSGTTLLFPTCVPFQFRPRKLIRLQVAKYSVAPNNSALSLA